MSGLFGGGSPSVYQRTEVAPPAKTEDLAVSNAANAAMLRRRLAYGSSKTILAGELGPAPTSKKTLLGE